VSGIKVNIIPKDGGNTFVGLLFISGTNHSLQSNNLTPDLVAHGLTAVSGVKSMWDVNPAFGGRIVKDKLWFYTAERWWNNDNYVAGLYLNKNPLAYTYT